MKKAIIKTTFSVLFSLLLFSCNENQTIESDSEETILETPEKLFAIKTFEIFEVLTTEDIPATDLKVVIVKDEKGFLNAKFSLIGESLEKVHLGSFVKESLNKPEDGGTTCDSKWSCGKAIYKCLEKGKDALISAGACRSASYCVTCQKPK
jgi:hypothetical protein